MKFQTHNEVDVNCIGTSFQGYLDISYDDLCSIFGQPFDGSYKVDKEWELLFEDGVVATIYNYKDGVNYLGDEEGIPFELIRDWHVGGFDKRSVERIVFEIKNK